MQGESIINDTANYVLYYILYHIYIYNINTPFFYTVFNGVDLRYKQLEDIIIHKVNVILRNWLNSIQHRTVRLIDFPSWHPTPEVKTCKLRWTSRKSPPSSPGLPSLSSHISRPSSSFREANISVKMWSSWPPSRWLLDLSSTSPW